MSHVRQQIREAVKVVLTAALPTHKVFASRKYKINATELPMIDMKFLNENGEYITMGSRQERTASLYVRVTHAASETNIDDVLDDVAVAAEHAMAIAGQLNGLLIDIGLVQTNFTDSTDGDKVLAELVLRYDVVYRVSDTDVETAKG